MSKARVDWTFGESPVGSAKLDQVSIDHITPGLPIWSFAYSAFWDSTLTPNTVTPAPNIGFYPYHPDKSVYDRLYLIGRAVRDGAEFTNDIEISFDSGGSWTGAFPSSTAAPVSFGTDTFSEIWNLDTNVVGFQWLGIRHNLATFDENYHLRLLGFLYSSDDDPF